MQTIQPSGIDPRLFRTTMSRFATGVTVVTTVINGQVHGMTANAFLSVSLDPPLVLVSIGQRARMHSLLPHTGRYGVSVLAEHQEELSGHFAGRVVDGLAISWTWHHDVPLLDGAAAYVVARVVMSYPAGDHTLYVGQVEQLAYNAARPLLFHAGRYGQLAS